VKREAPFRVLIVAGGSGGHIFPAIATAQDLKARFGERVDIHFVVNMNRRVPVGEGLEGFRVTRWEFKRSWVGLARLVARSFVLMRRERPRWVLGFGGFAGIPLLVLAKAFGARTLIHEQNVVPGRANRFLKPWSDRIAVTFPETKAYFGRHNDRVFIARYPMRSSLVPVGVAEGRAFFDLAPDVFTVLVIGGSQGASAINEIVMKAWRATSAPSHFQVIHVAGAMDASRVEEAYRKMGVRSRVFSFLKEMHFAYSAADLVIGRAGAGCVQEVLFFGKPSILIPYRHAAGHQSRNARFVARQGAAFLVEEGSVSSEMFADLVRSIKEDPMRQKTMAALARGMAASFVNLKVSDLVNFI
jgi:UDP-N-acetylglucosamine--N-acetylmuramyl-(pentapeptide) pyrophosphoryl-undecaprenol N-acetylglucosamine transferase